MSPVAALLPRPEYRALVDRLPALMREFDCVISEDALDDIAVFMAATEHVDRVLDAIAEPAHRHAFGGCVVAAIDRADVDHRLPGDLAVRLDALRQLATRRDVRGALVDLVRDALTNTERMRTTREMRTFLDCVEREGRLTVELALLFIAPHGSARFVDFFRSVGELANLVDKLVDSRGDARRGELAMHPGVRLHAQLVVRTLRRIPGAMARHPRPTRFVAWGLSWLPLFQR